jgi:hypothetical protein
MRECERVSKRENERGRGGGRGEAKSGRKGKQRINWMLRGRKDGLAGGRDGTAQRRMSDPDE